VPRASTTRSSGTRHAICAAEDDATSSATDGCSVSRFCAREYSEGAARSTRSGNV
jgi:hypothetical protein